VNAKGLQERGAQKTDTDHASRTEPCRHCAVFGSSMKELRLVKKAALIVGKGRDDA